MAASDLGVAHAIPDQGSNPGLPHWELGVWGLNYQTTSEVPTLCTLTCHVNSGSPRQLFSKRLTEILKGI